MKKAILLSLIFYGYQFLVSLLFILGNVVMGKHDPQMLDDTSLGISLLLSGGLMAAHLLLCRDARFTWRSFVEVPLRVLLLCLPLVLSAMYVLNVVGEQLNLPNWGEEVFLRMSCNPFGIASMVLVAPFVEELLFRGAIEGHFLKQGKSPAFAIVVSSLFFAVVHGNPAQIPFAFLIGLLLGWLYYRTGSILPGVCCHVVNNGVAVWLMNVQPDARTADLAGGDALLMPTVIGAAVVFVVTFLYARRVVKRF